jgi:hypothetical protein
MVFHKKKLIDIGCERGPGDPGTGGTPGDPRGPASIDFFANKVPGSIPPRTIFFFFFSPHINFFVTKNYLYRAGFEPEHSECWGSFLPIHPHLLFCLNRL